MFVLSYTFIGMAALKPEDLVVGEKYSIRFPAGVADDKLKERHSGVLKAKIQKTFATWDLDFEPKGFRRTPDIGSHGWLSYRFEWPKYEVRALGSAPKPNKNTAKRIKRTEKIMNRLLDKRERLTPDEVAELFEGVDINAVQKYPISVILNLLPREKSEVEAIDLSLLDAVIHGQFEGGENTRMKLVTMLLDAGANPSLGLVSAVATAHRPIIHQLLERGADINVERKAYRGQYTPNAAWYAKRLLGEIVVLQRPLDMAIPALYTQEYGYRQERVYPRMGFDMMLYLLELDAEVTLTMIDHVKHDIEEAKNHLRTQAIEPLISSTISTFIEQQTTQTLPALEAAYIDQHTRPESVEYHAARERFYGRPFSTEERENRNIAADLAMLTIPKTNKNTAPIPVPNFNKTMKAWNTARKKTEANMTSWEVDWFKELRKPPVLAPLPSPPAIQPMSYYLQDHSRRSSTRKAKQRR